MTSNLNEQPPVLWEEGVNNCGGDEDMFRMMVEKFEELSFTKNMKLLFDFIMQMNYDGIKEEAHTIKGPLG